MKERMKPYILEACVDSVESTIAAARGGADRLELCGALVIGGLTPGPSLFRQVRKACDIPIHVLVRPRYGDFLYTEAEFEILLSEVEELCRLGADGIVTGCLRADGTLDTERMEQVRERMGQKHLAIHRAFDMCRDPYAALEEAVSLGVDTILTSGQKDNCRLGAPLLRELVRQADGQLDILVGGGVTGENIAGLLKETGAKSFHMSGKIIADSGMVYRKEDVHMGIGGMGEYGIIRTSEEQIRQAVKVLEQCGA